MARRIRRSNPVVVSPTGIALVVAMIAMAGCGSDDGSSTAPAPPAAPAAPDASLPRVDLSLAPVADDPDPVVRAGAAALFLECEHGVRQGGWANDYGPMGSGADPAAAIADLFETETLALPDAFAPGGADTDRVLFVHEVSGVAKAAIVVADATVVDLDAEADWAIEAFAHCDPSEFDPATDHVFPMSIWTDVDGRRVPTWVISSANGPEHCGWESATFLDLDGRGYVADPGDVFDRSVLTGGFDDDAALPDDAVDIGYRLGDARLWLASDGDTAYVVDGERVEAWPAVVEPFACG